MSRRTRAVERTDTAEARSRRSLPITFAAEPIEMVQSDPNLERQLRELEESHLRADIRSSPESMRALLADEFVEFGSSGRIYDRAAVIASLSGQPHFNSRIDDFVVRALSSEVALTTYKLSAWSTSGGQVRVTLRSSVWVHRAGSWVLVFHQGTLASEGIA
jgi:hypothetical protein